MPTVCATLSLENFISLGFKTNRATSRHTFLTAVLVSSVVLCVEISVYRWFSFGVLIRHSIWGNKTWLLPNGTSRRCMDAIGFLFVCLFFVVIIGFFAFFFCSLGRGNFNWEAAFIGLTCGHVWGGVFLINDWHGRAQTTADGLWLYRKAGWANLGSKPASSTPPWSLLRFLPPGGCLSSCPDCLSRWTINYKMK